MALGGGNFERQDKVLPGTYINVVSGTVESQMSERGTVATTLSLDWGAPGEVIRLTASNFYENAEVLFGYKYTHEKMQLLRDLFKHASDAYCYRLGSDGVKAANEFCTAKYVGIRGNDLTTVISPDVDDPLKFKVDTLLENDIVDSQIVLAAGELVNNEWVDFIPTAQLVATAGTPLDAGANPTIVAEDYQKFLDSIESYSFNVLACPAPADEVKGLFVEFTKRLRDTIGVKFQTVVHAFEGVDYEGVINVKNNESTDIVFWVSGAAAQCPINKSLTNAIYNGEEPVDAKYTQMQLEEAIKAGEFVLHQVGEQVRVLTDVNTLVTFTDKKNKEFSNNQTIRIVDQIAMDTASIFNTKYLGTIPNNDSGRISLWNDVVKHRTDLQNMQAIENFKSEDVVVSPGENKKSVVINETVTIVNAMEQLYVTTVVQ